MCVCVFLYIHIKLSSVSNTMQKSFPKGGILEQRKDDVSNSSGISSGKRGQHIKYSQKCLNDIIHTQVVDGNNKGNRSVKVD